MIGRKAKRKFSPPRSAADRTTTRSDIDCGWVEETSSGMNRTKSTSHHYNLRLSVPRPAYYDKPTHSQNSGAKATKQPPSPNVNDNCKLDHCDDAKPTHSQKTGAKAKEQPLSPYVKDVRVVEEREGFIHEVLLGADGTEFDFYAFPVPMRSYPTDEFPVPPRQEGVSLFASFFPGYELDVTHIDSDEFEDEDEDETADGTTSD